MFVLRRFVGSKFSRLLGFYGYMMKDIIARTSGGCPSLPVSEVNTAVLITYIVKYIQCYNFRPENKFIKVKVSVGG